MESPSAKKDYKEALRLADEEFAILCEKRKELILKFEGNQPPKYKKIQSNNYVDCKKIIDDGLRPQVCKCTPKHPCDEVSGCVNRAMFVECDKSCPQGELCENKRFQKKQYSKTKRIYDPAKGWGLKSHDEISRDQFILEYVGSVISDQKKTRKN